MQQAISTRYIGPSATRGSRIKATARLAEWWGDERKPELSLTDSYNDGHHTETNHARVAELLAVKLKWSGVYVGGHNPDGEGYTFVNMGGSIAPDRNELVNAMARTGNLKGRDYFIVLPEDRNQ